MQHLSVAYTVCNPVQLLLKPCSTPAASLQAHVGRTHIKHSLQCMSSTCQLQSGAVQNQGRQPLNNSCRQMGKCRAPSRLCQCRSNLAVLAHSQLATKPCICRDQSQACELNSPSAAQRSGTRSIAGAKYSAQGHMPLWHPYARAPVSTRTGNPSQARLLVSNQTLIYAPQFPQTIRQA